MFPVQPVAMARREHPVVVAVVAVAVAVVSKTEMMM